MPRSPGRPKQGQATLTRALILQTALVLIDTEGIEACSMRRLAAALEVDPMALYHHVANKQALLAGVVGLVVADFQVAAPPDRSWQAQVRAVAQAYHALIRAHPHLALYIISRNDLSAQVALPVNEALYQALTQAGLSPVQVIQAADTLIDYLHGYLLGEQSGQVGQPGERQPSLDLLAASPPQHFPTLRAVYAALPPQEAASSLEAGLDLLLAGIVAQANQESRGMIYIGED